MLHLQKIVQNKTQISAGAAASMITKENSAFTLLATAQIQVDSASGEKVLLTALLDQGSQRTSISEEATQILRLHRTKSRTDLIGPGNTLVETSKSTVEIVIRPRFESNNSYKIKAQPNNYFKEDLKKWDNYCLADPMFNKSDRIDVVLGADILAEILPPGLRKWGKILGQETSLGWILSGVINTSSTVTTIISAVTADIEKFWEIEEVRVTPEINEIDEECENLRLKEMAMAKLLFLEKRFKRNSKLKTQYVKFMKEYMNMDHMEKVSKMMFGKFYMPHQAIIRDDHSTTKVRAVFDASAKTSNGKSLNEILHTGPKPQLDIFQLLIKWRLWKYVMTADIEKMYRQVLVPEED
ncbi:uncharacterized protein LOC119666023 [Teleopsis dalmanni]|uniref:uncharacterized protein LOC119663145 n=1 Tax=Teleopsis dalmanni TaxID=139649 RepID=UPI0018CE2888|nr:uncharacterized protein LOC119663145 [Teleopsis dalmanni]XP_037929110.1 uncharacterized protein LOC119663572 [Teleopsis dalmanni]XP_037931212.1 uncharacterized protein LOC119666023 [Teleopsis dalmanni]